MSNQQTNDELPACDVQFLQPGYWSVYGYFYQESTQQIVYKRKIFCSKIQGFKLLEQLYIQRFIDYDDVANWWHLILTQALPIMNHAKGTPKEKKDADEKQCLHDVEIQMQEMQAKDRAISTGKPQIVSIANSNGELNCYIVTESWRSPVFGDVDEGFTVLDQGISASKLPKDARREIMRKIRAIFFS